MGNIFSRGAKNLGKTIEKIGREARREAKQDLNLAKKFKNKIGGGGQIPDYQATDEYPAIPPPRPIGMPPPADMTEYYKVMAENQRYQNELAGKRADIAERQNAIGEDLYAKSKEYRPIEKQVIEQAQRGLDPSIYASRARNAAIQQAASGPQQLMAGQRMRGVSASSPAAVASLSKASRLAGEQLGGITQAEQQRIRDINLATKGQVVALGNKIPEQTVTEYGMASDIMGQAGALVGQSAGMLASQYATQQQMDQSYAMLGAQTGMANARLQLEYQQLKMMQEQHQRDQQWTEWQAKEQLNASRWGMVPIVGPIAYGVKNATYICTELLRQGLVDQRTYDLAAEFDRRLPVDVVTGYRTWALSVSLAMRRSSLLTSIVRPFAVSYMDYAASSILGLPRPVLGAIVYNVGAPVCRLIAKIFKHRSLPCEI